MKKQICFVLLCCMMTIIGACGSVQDEKDENVIQLYYVSNTETKVEMHEYATQSQDINAQIEEIIDKLSTVPDKLEYKPPLNMGFSILNYEVEDGRLQLDVDEGYRSLKPTTEVLVRAALVRSFTQLKGISYVSVTIEGEQLHDSLGNVVGLMSAEQFIDNDGNEINTYEKARLKLYFANEEGNGLLAVNRTLAYSTNVPIERLVVEQILAGPGDDLTGVYPTVNSDTKLLSILTKDGICYVNLDQAFLTPVSSATAELTIYSIVNSLTELSGINKVQILINGETNVTYREMYSLATVFERNLDLVTTSK